MSYLLDKKIKKKKFLNIALIVFVCLILFYFRSSIFQGLAFVSHTIFRPVFIVANSIGGKLKSSVPYFVSKNSLYLQNQNLQSKIIEDENRMSNYNSILSENISLKEILGRKDEKIPMILSTILSKLNKSLYDTFIIDIGTERGLQTGETVFALGNVPVGRVATVYPNSSKVVLFSSAGEKTQAVISGKDVFVELIGRGGGNFEMVMPLDFTILKGDEVVLPGIAPYVLGVVETIISDPRDSFIKVLLVSPVNVQELKFVQVELKK